MNERKFDRIANDFLADGPTVLADRVLDAALGDVHVTRQRRVLWRSPWRFPNMNTFAKLAVAAVAVIAVGYLGLNLLGPAGPGVGGPSAVPSPSVAPTATPAPTATTAPTATPLPSAPPLTGQFTSERHGYTISHPEAWSTRTAATPWTSGYVDFGQTGADLIYDPVLESDLFLVMASQPFGGRTRDAWLADVWAIVAADDAANADCATKARRVTVGGSPGLMCGNLVLVTTDDRGYWIQLYTSDDAPETGMTYDNAWFESVLATVELHPEDAIDE